MFFSTVRISGCSQAVMLHSVAVNASISICVIQTYVGQGLSLFTVASTQGVQAFLRGEDSTLAPCGSRLRARTSPQTGFVTGAHLLTYSTINTYF